MEEDLGGLVFDSAPRGFVCRLKVERGWNKSPCLLGVA